MYMERLESIASGIQKLKAAGGKSRFLDLAPALHMGEGLENRAPFSPAGQREIMNKKISLKRVGQSPNVKPEMGKWSRSRRGGTEKKPTGLPAHPVEEEDLQNASFCNFIIDSLPVGVVTVNPKRIITSFNPWAETLTGYSEKRENVEPLTPRGSCAPKPRNHTVDPRRAIRCRNSLWTFWKNAFSPLWGQRTPT